MTDTQHAMIIGDFEKYMRHILASQHAFSLESFVTFSSSLVNFYQGSNLITESERIETALILSRSFNAGMSNRITTDDLNSIAELIISDLSIDYSVLNPIFV
ncbi:hypothetical protein ORI89_12590 [Sphingobacterium sp. UT-1RO-CII-1]|uniref:hypothetical protein n=1 Tax=Sphingobacterium sp. UT-1RO-CII-1 TaxID=2995225 RepID=UPI00227BBD5E|nr:hypothetical protein [Sphingobacterium sp. UT-1RO-CII-1]MCY4780493.1 hypothetical protein [Sphingobacterium sp. UT-1RO-CII-1]